MICPACRHDMIVVEYKKVELDYCANCKGVWFDEGELNLFLRSIGEDMESFNFANFPEIESSEKRRKCPICNRKMIKSNVQDCPTLVLDVCPVGDGLWFDGGEINTLVKQVCVKAHTDDDSQRQIIGFMEQVFKSQE